MVDLPTPPFPLNIDLDLNTLNPLESRKCRVRLIADLPGNRRLARGQDELNGDISILNTDLLDQTKGDDVS